MSFFFDNTPFPVRFHGMHPGYRGISQLHDDIDRIFGGFMGRPENEPVAPDKMADFLPDIDLTSDEKNYVMKVELPGVSPEDVDIKLDDGVLTISGEKKEETTDDKTKSHVKERRFGQLHAQHDPAGKTLTPSTSALPRRMACLPFPSRERPLKSLRPEPSLCKRLNKQI